MFWLSNRNDSHLEFYHKALFRTENYQPWLLLILFFHQLIIQQTQNAGKYIEQHKDQYKKHLKTYEDYNAQAGKMLKPNQELGLMEGLVGSATDGIIGKPERKRMINKFLRESLNPEFKNKLTIISSNLLTDMQNSLNQEATITLPLPP